MCIIPSQNLGANMCVYIIKKHVLMFRQHFNIGSSLFFNNSDLGYVPCPFHVTFVANQ